MTSVVSVVAPDFARLHAGGRKSELQSTVTNAARLMFVAVLPFALIAANGAVTWEAGTNHSYTVPSSGTGSVTVNWQY